MEFITPLFVSTVMFVVMLAIGVFTVVIQLELINSSKLLLELQNDVSKLSHDTSRNISAVSKDMSRNIFELSTKTSELSENFSNFSESFHKSFDNFKTDVWNTFNKNHDPSGLYLFGGHHAGEDLSSASRWNNFTGKWEQIESMSTKKHLSCGAVIRNKIYLFGGLSSYNSNNQAEVYDSITGTYEQLRSMPQTRFGCGAAVLNDSIYVAGGSSSASVIRYNIQSDQWTAVSSMNVERDYLELVLLNGNLYAIAGYKLNSMEIYNADTNQWSMGASTQYQHSSFGAAVHEGNIYVCSELGFEVYRPFAKRWSTLTLLKNAYGTKLVSMNCKLWAVGGYSSKSVFTYDTITGYWTQQADMDVERADHVALVVNL